MITSKKETITRPLNEALKNARAFFAPLEKEWGEAERIVKSKMIGWQNEQITKAAKEATLKKIRDTYADKKRRTFNPKENEKFLNEIVADVYSKKYKTEITLEEAQMITELSNDLEKARLKMKPDFTWENEEDGIKFGSAQVALNNYYNGLKTEAEKEEFISPKEGIIKSAVSIAKISVNFIANNSRALKASLDISYWLRQGIKAFYRPDTAKIWMNNFNKSFSATVKTIKGGIPAGDALLDAAKAYIYSKTNYLNGRYEMGIKLDIGTGEEELTPSLMSKIPLLGKFFKASEVNYELGAMVMRSDLADKFYSLAEKAGVDMNNKEEIGAINDMVNSMTGRGSLGRMEKTGQTLNKVFFSAKFFKANLDTLIKPFTAKTPFARKQAAINLLSMVSGIAVILMIANTLDDDSVDFDPRSSNFGKIKKGNTRFDITGGLSSLIILAARLATQSSKSSTTGIMTKFGDGYGSPTGMDAIWNFTENKFSPVFSVIKDLINQETFEGDKPTIMKELQNLTVPIVIETGFDAAKKDNLAMAILSVIADGLGISANTYDYSVNWENNIGKELNQFKEKIGPDEFKKANDKYNQQVNDWFEKMENNEKYQSLSNEDKKTIITSKKSEIKEDIFKEYKFKYKKEKKDKLPEF